jgi:hypothetical protein
LLNVTALVDRQPSKWFVEQQHFRILRQRHGDLDTAALAIGGLGQRPVRDMCETNPFQGRMRTFDKVTLPLKIDQRVPACRRQAE